MCVVGAVLLRLEEEDGAVPEVEVNEVFRLCNLDGAVSRPSWKLSSHTKQLTMRDKTTKVPSYYTVPCCSLARVEL